MKYLATVPGHRYVFPDLRSLLAKAWPRRAADELAGLDYPAALDKLLYLSREARRLGLSGVALKDEMPDGKAIPEGVTPALTVP